MRQLILVLLLVLGKGAYGCRLLVDSSWNWSDSELVRNTDDILLVEAIAKNQSKIKRKGFFGGRNDYWFVVIKVLKGAYSQEYLTLKGFNGEQSKPGQNAVYGMDCSISFGFVPGKTYLVYKGAFHPKAYLLVNKSGEKVREVEKLISEVEPIEE